MRNVGRGKKRLGEVRRRGTLWTLEKIRVVHEQKSESVANEIV